MALITQVEAAKIAGVSKQAIHKLKKEGRQNFFKGSKIDTDHPDWIAYTGMHKSGMQTNGRKKGEGSGHVKELKGLKKEADSLVDQSKLHHMLLQGKVAKIKADIDKAELDFKIKRGEYVDKQFLITNVFQYLELLNNQLFDYPESNIDILIAEIESDREKARGAIPEKMRKDFSRIIKEAKRNIKRALEKIGRDEEQ